MYEQERRRRRIRGRYGDKLEKEKEGRGSMRLPDRKGTSVLESGMKDLEKRARKNRPRLRRKGGICQDPQG